MQVLHKPKLHCYTTSSRIVREQTVQAVHCMMCNILTDVPNLLQAFNFVWTCRTACCGFDAHNKSKQAQFGLYTTRVKN